MNPVPSSNSTLVGIPVIIDLKFNYNVKYSKSIYSANNDNLRGMIVNLLKPRIIFLNEIPHQ